MVKVLFFGTPAIAVPYLEWLTHHAEVLGVVCRPDEPSGRGQEMHAPPTKLYAAKNNIPVFQPAGPWTDAVVAPLKKLNADIGIAVAYGRILPKSVLTAAKQGCLNVHFSLLPKYRGAAPMQWALINGETKTGVTIFWLEESLDSGPIFHQRAIDIAPDDDAIKLEAKLVPLGIKVLEEVLKDLEKGTIKRDTQSGPSSPAPILKKEHGKIDWTKPAADIVNLVRGVCVWPGAMTHFTPKGHGPKQLKIFHAGIFDDKNVKSPGTVTDVPKNQGVVVQAGKGRVLLLEVQPEGKKVMPAYAFWQGSHMNVGEKFE